MIVLAPPKKVAGADPRFARRISVASRACCWSCSGGGFTHMRGRLISRPLCGPKLASTARKKGNDKMPTIITPPNVRK
jgi:hypothetical protein